jgi:hypothetical protein
MRTLPWTHEATFRRPDGYLSNYRVVPGLPGDGADHMAAMPVAFFAPRSAGTMLAIRRPSLPSRVSPSVLRISETSKRLECKAE